MSYDRLKNCFSSDPPEERVRKETTKLQEQFRGIVRSAFRAITAQNVTVDLFIASLANLSIEHMELHKDFLEKISSDISKESTLGMVWVKLATYWNFLNYFLLEQVVCEFGDQILNDSIQEYKPQILLTFFRFDSEAD